MTQVHESPGRDASEPSHPCLRCGACCAVYRVAFHWLEVADVDGVPEELTQPLDPHRLEMRKLSDGRCVALSGTIGQEARCTMYGRRPSVCRELTPAWEDDGPARSATGRVPGSACRLSPRPTGKCRPPSRPRPPRAACGCSAHATSVDAAARKAVKKGPDARSPARGRASWYHSGRLTTYCTLSSVRRLRARPSAVSLVSIGRDSP